VSLFFAVWGNDDEDAGLYIVPRPNEPDKLEKNPFGVKAVRFFYPGYVTPRLVSQRGLFTVHPNPWETYYASGMRQIIIDSGIKHEFRQKLDALGTNDAAIYADLDGLSRRLVAVQGFRSTAVTTRPATVMATSGVASKAKINPRDPQKGQWGGSPVAGGWSLTAEVKEVQEDWYSIKLTVKAGPGRNGSVTKPVTFYLHNSFKEPVRIVAPSQGRAELKVWAYGAFTVGAVVQQDGTTLELDLAELEAAPKRFREQ
jgi:hypothetical protein